MLVFEGLGIHSGPSGRQDSNIFSGSASSLLERFSYTNASHLPCDVMQDLNLWKSSQVLEGMTMNQTPLFGSCAMQLTLPFSIMVRLGEENDLTMQNNIDHDRIQLYKGACKAPGDAESQCKEHEICTAAFSV